jgi:hypothetical protein
MADKDVKILLEAEDKASAVLEQVAKKVEDNVKQIRSTGEATKKSTELVGTFANALGDTGLGSFASQFAALTEKASAFSETMKDGAGNSLAFKAGLVGLAGVIGFSVGKAIGDVIFQTQRWKEELAALGEESKRLAGALTTVADRRFALIQEEIQLFADPEEQRQAAKDALLTIEKEIANTRARISQEFNEEAQGLDPWFGSAQDRAEIKRQFEESRQELQGNLDALNRQADALRSQTSERRANIEAQKEANAAQEKSASYIANLQQEIQLLKAKKDEVNAITAAQAVGATGDLDGAEALLNERDKLKAAQAHADEIKKLTADLEKQLDIERLGVDLAKQKEQLAIAANEKERATIEILQRQINQEKERTAAIKQAEKDAEEANKKRIEDAKKLAEEEAARKEKFDEFQTGTQAVESRLLTRGPAERGIDKIAKSTEDTVKELSLLRQDIDRQQQGKALQLEFVV